MTENLFQKIKTFGEKKKYSKWDILFEANHDYSLYLIEKGKISLVDSNNNIVFSVFEGSIIGEKSFVLKEPKKLKWIVDSDDTVVYVFWRDKFDSLEAYEKIEFLYSLVGYVSWRVYKINTILSLVNEISSLSIAIDVSNYKEKIENIFSLLINQPRWLLFKRQWNDLMYIDGSIYTNQQIQEFVKSNIDQTIRMGKNYIFIWVDWFYFIIFWQIEKDYYIIENSIRYSLSNFKFIGEYLEKRKNDFIKQTLKNGY